MMDYLKRMKKIAFELIENLCKNKCSSLGDTTVTECEDYIHKRIQKDDYNALTKYDKNSKASEKTYLYILVSSRILDFFNRNTSQNKYFMILIDLILQDFYDPDKKIGENTKNYTIDKELLSTLPIALKEIIHQHNDKKYLEYFYYAKLSTDEIGEIYNTDKVKVEQKLKNIRLYILRKLKNIGYIAEKINIPLLGEEELEKRNLHINEKITDLMGNSIGEYSIRSSLIKENDYSSLNKIIETLTSEEKTYLKYRYTDELSYKEIGNIFGITYQQASKKVENIQIKLKRKLQKAGLTLEEIL